LWAVGRCTTVRGYLRQRTLGTRHLAGLLPIGGDRATLFWSVPRGQMEGVRRGKFGAWREAVLRLEPLAEEVFEEVTDFEQVAFTTYYRVNMGRLFAGRAVCVGDAGHAMSPHLGQGANLALLDAQTLADCLAASDNLEEALRLYSANRQPQIAYYAALSWFLTPFFQSEGWVLGLGRDLGLPVMMRVPPLRREMERAMAGVRLGLFRGDMDVSRLAPARGRALETEAMAGL
jgi:2-polyprenyl-6-methoxyphenol hydroxylase-like FAD-dependent oxidoreductase